MVARLSFYPCKRVTEVTDELTNEQPLTVVQFEPTFYDCALPASEYYVGPKKPQRDALRTPQRHLSSCRPHIEEQRVRHVSESRNPHIAEAYRSSVFPAQDQVQLLINKFHYIDGIVHEPPENQRHDRRTHVFLHSPTPL
jgi:hypothetical protein